MFPACCGTALGAEGTAQPDFLSGQMGAEKLVLAVQRFLAGFGQRRSDRGIFRPAGNVRCNFWWHGQSPFERSLVRWRHAGINSYVYNFMIDSKSL